MSQPLPPPKRDRIANNEVRRYVQKREVFITHNKTIYAEYNGDLYIVYSYGHHFPMYIYDAQRDMWFGNSDKYSQTTSRHQSKARPSQDIDGWMDTTNMQLFIRSGGYVQHTAQRMVGDAHAV